MHAKVRPVPPPGSEPPEDRQDAPLPEEDPLIRQEVELALAPYEALLPPEALAGMREYLTDFAASHPRMRRLLDRLRPPKEVVTSDVREKDE